MNINHLIYFEELAKTQHMSKAAEKLGISQPSLSYAIKKLEEELGVPLFEPEGRNIKLTRLGQSYLQYIESGLQNLENGASFIQQSINPNQGHINLGFTYTLGQKLVPTLIKNFSNQELNSDITFNFFQNNTHELLESLYDEKYDLVLSSKLDQLKKQSTDSMFIFTKIVRQEIKLAVASDHPLAKKNTIYLNDLVNLPFITFDKKSGLRPLIDSIMASARIHPNIVMELEEDHSIIGFVEQNFGVALVPNLPQIDQSKVKLLSLSDNSIYHELFLVDKRNSFVTPSVNRFKKFIIDYCDVNYKQKDQRI